MAVKQVYSKSELNDLLEQEYSCVILVHTEKRIAIHPYYSNNVKAGVCKQLNQSLKKFDPRLNGLLMGFKDVKIHVAKSGRICSRTGGIEQQVELDYFVFQPVVGGLLKGVVNKRSNDHLGLLIHDNFNASILKPLETDNEDWNCQNYQIGDTVVFKVKHLDFSGPIPYIEGIIDDSSGEYKKNHKKKKIDVSKYGESFLQLSLSQALNKTMSLHWNDGSNPASYEDKEETKPDDVDITQKLKSDNHMTPVVKKKKKDKEKLRESCKAESSPIETNKVVKNIGSEKNFEFISPIEPLKKSKKKKKKSNEVAGIHPLMSSTQNTSTLDNIKESPKKKRRYSEMSMSGDSELPPTSTQKPQTSDTSLTSPKHKKKKYAEDEEVLSQSLLSGLQKQEFPKSISNSGSKKVSESITQKTESVESSTELPTKKKKKRSSDKKNEDRDVPFQSLNKDKLQSGLESNVSDVFDAEVVFTQPLMTSTQKYNDNPIDFPKKKKKKEGFQKDVSFDSSVKTALTSNQTKKLETSKNKTIEPSRKKQKTKKSTVVEETVLGLTVIEPSIQKMDFAESLKESSPKKWNLSGLVLPQAVFQHEIQMKDNKKVYSKNESEDRHASLEKGHSQEKQNITLTHNEENVKESPSKKRKSNKTSLPDNNKVTLDANGFLSPGSSSSDRKKAAKLEKKASKDKPSNKSSPYSEEIKKKTEKKSKSPKPLPSSSGSKKTPQTQQLIKNEGISDDDNVFMSPKGKVTNRKSVNGAKSPIKQTKTSKMSDPTIGPSLFDSTLDDKKRGNSLSQEESLFSEAETELPSQKTPTKPGKSKEPQDISPVNIGNYSKYLQDKLINDLLVETKQKFHLEDRTIVESSAISSPAVNKVKDNATTVSAKRKEKKSAPKSKNNESKRAAKKQNTTQTLELNKMKVDIGESRSCEMNTRECRMSVSSDDETRHKLTKLLSDNSLPMTDQVEAILKLMSNDPDNSKTENVFLTESAVNTTAPKVPILNESKKKTPKKSRKVSMKSSDLPEKGKENGSKKTKEVDNKDSKKKDKTKTKKGIAGESTLAFQEESYQAIVDTLLKNQLSAMEEKTSPSQKLFEDKHKDAKLKPDKKLKLKKDKKPGKKSKNSLSKERKDQSNSIVESLLKEKISLLNEDTSPK